MAQQNSIVEEGFDRLQEAFESVSEEVEALQKRFVKRRKTLERDSRKRVTAFQREFKRTELGKRALKLQKDTNKRIDRFQKDLQKTRAAKRLEKVRKDATGRVEGAVDNVLSSLQIATRSDVQKLDRKLNQINRKLREFEATE